MSQKSVVSLQKWAIIVCIASKEHPWLAVELIILQFFIMPTFFCCLSYWAPAGEKCRQTVVPSSILPVYLHLLFNQL